MGADFSFKTRHKPVFPLNVLEIIHPQKDHRVRKGDWIAETHNQDDRARLIKEYNRIAGYWYYSEGYCGGLQLGEVLGRSWWDTPMNTDSQRLKRLRNTVMKCSDRRIAKFCEKKYPEPKYFDIYFNRLCAKRDYLKAIFEAGIEDCVSSV